MTDNSSSGSFPAGFDGGAQVLTFLGPDGATEISIPIPLIDSVYMESLATQVNYGSQIGACFVMLLVVLTMTPKNRFARTPTLINIASLIICMIRVFLLSLFYTSGLMEFYTLFTEDFSRAEQRDFNVAAASTAFAIPQIMLIEAALAVQAWSMIQLWPAVYKWSALALSTAVIIVAIGFKIASSVLQILGTLFGTDIAATVWVRYVDLVMLTTSVSWFCFLFIVKLITHMWTHRTVLPSVKGLSAMEVLVMTNGVLMLIPVLFAGLSWGSWTNFESGSLTETLVVVVLPLGTLVAQRLANPAAFSSPHVSQNPGTGTASSKQPFLKSWPRSVTSRRGSRPVPGVTSHIMSDSSSHDNSPSAIDQELAMIDADDLEKGIRVNREFERHEEQLTRP